MIRAVLDTNVLVSAILSPLGNLARILRHWLHGDVALVTSAALLSELVTVLTRPRIRRRMAARQTAADELLELIAVRGEIITPQPLDLLPVRCRDPKDDSVLACALGGGADYLVTGDEDLLVLEGDGRLGMLHIVRVTEFLTLLQATA